MPFTNLDSWLPTSQEFINHWTQVNTELGPGGPMTLIGPYTVGNLTTDRADLDTKMTAVTAADNVLTNAKGDYDVKKAALVVRLKQFRGACTSLLAGSQYEKSPPVVPNPSSIGGKFITAFDDMASVWAQINATPPPGFTPPLALQGGYLIAAFNTELAAFRAAHTAYTNAFKNAGIAREARDIQFKKIYGKLKGYKGRCISLLASNSPLLATIPALSDPGGPTPDPVILTGVWVSSTGRLTWTASDHPDLDHYRISAHTGPKYKASEEQFVANVAAGTQLFDTLFGLGASGASMLFKVYVVLSTGNERGSNSVKITRP